MPLSTSSGLLTKDDEPRGAKAFRFTLSKNGLKLSAYVMFHGTKPGYVASILDNGFWKSKAVGNMLGEGVYTSRNPRKTETIYGTCTLKLVVYTGKVKKIDSQNHAMQKTWQKEELDFDSAHVPIKCGMVGSGREETCVKEAWQVKVLGVR